jgi:hypothetical protein
VLTIKLQMNKTGPAWPPRRAGGHPHGGVGCSDDSKSKWVGELGLIFTYFTSTIKS